MEASAELTWPDRCVGLRMRSWLPLAIPAAALVVGLLGCGEPTPLSTVSPSKARARPSHVHQVRHAPRPDPAASHFVAYALNALLVPLLDDDSPPRWADPSLSFDCEAVDVTVDGEPLDTGSPVQGGGFTVRWRMQRCTPFENIMELTGDVELRVEPTREGYRAVVQPMHLHVVSARGGREVLTEAFTARMSLGR